MIYDLPLDQHIGNFTAIDIEANKKIKAKIEGLTNLKKKLAYYNTNICSLSKLPMDGQIYFQWGNPNQVIKIYCGCKKCRSQPDFNPKDDLIFFKLRAKEVQRVVNGIADLDSYKDKLNFLFDTKGYVPDQTPKVYPNCPFDGDYERNGEVWAEPVIDLLPTTKEERTIYNDFVKREFDKEYSDKDGFSKAYTNFDFKKEKQRFETALEISVERKKLIEYLTDKIERHFDYPESINAEYEENYITRKINQRIEEDGLTTNCFTKMVLGVPIDLNEHTLNSYALMQYTHISEVFKFYRYLKELLESRVNQKQLFRQIKNRDKNEDIIKQRNEMNINEVLLLGLNEPDYSRVEFWQIHQRQSGYSAIVFWRKLVDSWKFYTNKIEYKIGQHEALGTEVMGMRLPLLPETNFKLTGHFGKFELGILNESLIEYEDKIKAQNVVPQKEPIEGIAKQSDEQILSIIKTSENKFWKGLPMERVINHFEVLTKKKNKNDEVFLTVDQLISFLRRGFLNDSTQPKQRINCSMGEKGFVLKRFYEFFDLAVSQYGFPSKKKPFIELFSHCFDNWAENTIEPLFKPNKTKERW